MRTHLDTAIRIRVGIALLLLCGFYACGLVLLGSAIWLAVEAVATFGGAASYEVTYAAAALVLAFSVPVWQVIRAKPEVPDGIPLTEAQAPELWHVVREVASAVHAPLPDEIRLSAQANAGAFENAGRFGLRPGRRYLYLGVPLLEMMPVTYLRAIIAHELGHFGDGHTAAGAAVYRAGTTMVMTLARLRGRIAGALLSVYVALFFAIALAGMRQMEIEADAAAARVTGADVFGRALSALPRLQAAWQGAVDRCAVASRERECDRERLLEDARAIAARSADPEPDPASEARWGTHPPLAERLRLLMSRPAETMYDDDDDNRAGTALVVDRNATLAALDADTLLLPAADHAAERDGQRLLSATGSATIRRPGLGGILDMLETGNSSMLAALTETTVADAVFALIGTELVRSGQAQWSLEWGRRLALRAEDGQEVEPRPAVAVACFDPSRVAQLRALLREWGCDEKVTSAWAQPTQRALHSGSLTGASEPTLADRLYVVVRR